MEAWMSLEDGAEQHLMSYVREIARAMASQHRSHYDVMIISRTKVGNVAADSAMAHS